MNKVLKISLLLLFSILSLMLAYIRYNDKEANKLIEAVSFAGYSQIYQPEKYIESQKYFSWERFFWSVKILFK